MNTSRVQYVLLTATLIGLFGFVSPVHGQHVRRNINGLTVAQLAALRHGIEVMKSRPETDATSWAFQANIHGTPGPESDPLFKDCQHGTEHFLTWHRGYLYYFERILRKASGDPTLALPYWDWSIDRAVPLSYRQPADVGNPLFHARSINNGSLLPTSVVVFDRDSALTQPTFEWFSSSLEGSPHGVLHGMIGGEMGFVSTSARDPIFWLHHGNVDRLWNLWLNQSIHSNPTQAAFLDHEFHYVDENGIRVTRKVRDIISSADLGYRYDNVLNPVANETPAIPELAALPAPSEGHSHETAGAAGHDGDTGHALDHSGPGKPEAISSEESELIASSRLPSSTEGPQPPAQPERLEFVAKTIPLTFAESGAEALSATVERTSDEVPDRIELLVYGLHVAATPTYTYGVYLNLPPDADEERSREHYVASLNFFGLAEADQRQHEGHGNKPQVLDASKTVARLQNAGVWDADRLDLTFVPIIPTPPTGAAEAANRAQRESAKNAEVSFDRVELRIVRGQSDAGAHAPPEHAAPTGNITRSPRVALPLPPSRREVLDMAMEPQLGDGSVSEGAVDRTEILNRLWDERARVAHDLDVLDAEIVRHTTESFCQGGPDFQDVEQYDGLSGVDQQFVKTHEAATGQLQWVSDLADRFSSPGETPGEVNAVRWGSGGLIGPDLFLTAGHCFDPDSGGWEMPQRNGVTISPHEIATLMKVNFGYQVDPATGNPRRAKSFPVVQLIEYREGALDYAIVRLGPNAAGELPGQLFGTLSIAESDLATPGAMLCLIQHPNGLPKKVHAGPLKSNSGARITYATLDTLGGSSGALILGPSGTIVGVHTNGGCDTALGYNFGVPIGAIKLQSPTIP